MTSRYRVEYALKTHHRDEFIEWMKALLAVPFVLHSDIETEKLGFENISEYEEFIIRKELRIEQECRKRYYEVFEDVEKLIDNTIALDAYHKGFVPESRLRKLVPSIGHFYTRLPLTEAFLVEDAKRSISKRRLVSPSFNDIRKILNTAQIISLAEIYNDKVDKNFLKLITFDGDVTIYDDGKSLIKTDVIVQKLMKLLELGFFIGLVTAAGYPGQQGAIQYYSRLKGLIDAINESDLPNEKKCNLLVMGGESNYLFRYDNEIQNLKFVEAHDWYLPLMMNWRKDYIEHIMELLHRHLVNLRRKFNLDDDSKTLLIRKERSIGIIPINNFRIIREYLEEIVLSCFNRLNDIINELDCHDIKVCAFNGGSDVWVDIGDKSVGVESLQKYLCKDGNHDVCPILKSESLHIGDQFASLGANDFKARLSACTVWISSPQETVEILDELIKRTSVSDQLAELAG